MLDEEIEMLAAGAEGGIPAEFLRGAGDVKRETVIREE